MALDIFKLAHADDFDLNTATLGVLKCCYPDIDKLKSALQGHPSDSPTEQREFVQLVLLASAHKPVEGVEFQENPLTEEEVKQLSQQELDEFAAKQAKRVYGRLECEQEHTVSPYLALLNALIQDDKVRRVDLERIRDQFSHVFTQDSTIGAILKNLKASSALGATLAAIKEQKSVLLEPPPAIETIRPLNFKNPVLETNTKLDKFLEGIDEIKPVITQTAGMLQSLNDAAIKMQNEFIVASTNAEEQARRATRLAVIGIFISAIGLIFSTYFSYRSMIDSQVSQTTAKTDSEKASKEAGEKVELLQKELQAIRAAVEQSSSKPVPQKQPRHSAAQ